MKSGGRSATIPFPFRRVRPLVLCEGVSVVFVNVPIIYQEASVVSVAFLLHCSLHSSFAFLHREWLPFSLVW